MDSTQTLPLTLKPNKLKLAGSLLLSIVFTAGAIWMRPSVPFLAVVMAIFFALCIIVFGVQFLPGCANLVLREDGFAVTHMFRKNEYNWADIKTFSTHNFPGNKIVTWSYTEDFRVQNSDRGLANRVMQTEASLPDTYGMTAEELTDMLNELLQQHR